MRYFLNTILFLLAVLGGILGGYFFARHFGIGYSVWGNTVDGWSGDAGYKSYHIHWWNKLWPDWWWSCIRNPAKNLCTGFLAVEGTIQAVEEIGPWGHVTLTDGRTSWFWYNKDAAYEMKFGWMWWRDQIKHGMMFRAEYVFNP